MGLMTIPIFFMRILGIWPVELMQQGLQRCCYRIYSVITLSFFAVFLVLLFIGCINLVGSPLVSPERINSSVAVILAATLAAIKIVIYCKYRLPYVGYSVFEQEQKLVLDDAEGEKLYKKINKYAQYIYFALMSGAGASAAFYIIGAFVSLNELGYNNWNLDDKAFMFELYLPFEKNSHLIGIVICNLFAAFLIYVSRISGNLMYYSLVLFGKFQLQLLQLRVRKFDEQVRKSDGDIKLVTVELVKDHQETIRFIKNLNDYSKYPLLLEFLLNSFNLATILFQISTSIFVVSYIDICFSFVFLCFICLEIYALAWTANEIKLQSLSIGDAICDGPWYEHEERIKKLLVFIILRTQKPLRLTLGPFSPLTMDTIIWMLKASYSYFALMKRTYDRNKQLH
ncbi:odorant receptor 10-like [Euwallacea fornicatus]|uniref:odorant receptor 10-like n=1 Tax=Euwallacea fornicatus TaxID=995702 RepID=UPI00338E1585